MSENKRQIFYSPSGEKIQPVYGMVFNKGNQKAEPGITGTQDWYGQIQSYKEGTELHSVLSMIQNGVIPQSQIDRYIGQIDKNSYFDVTGVPTSFVEASELDYKITEQYNALPADLKAVFGSDIDQMRADVKSGAFNDKVKAYFESKKKPEVNSNADAK